MFCGVQVVIYRLGLMCADSRSGACNEHDLYTMLFDAMLKMSCYPKSAAYSQINGLPVDFAAKSIVHLSGMGEDVYGKIYHVVDPVGEIKFQDIIDGMRRCGIEMKGVSDNEWKMKLKMTSGRHNDFESLEIILEEYVR